MTTLADLLLAPGRRDALIADLVALAEGHVAQRSGLRGVALRAGLAAVRRKVPDAVPRAVGRLLPDLVAALEPLHARSRARGGVEFARALKRDKAAVAGTLMGMADARVARSTHATVKAFYARLRATAGDEAEDLVPALADVLARHLP
jgi:hypothetical protein